MVDSNVTSLKGLCAHASIKEESWKLAFLMRPSELGTSGKAVEINTFMITEQ